MKVKGFEVFRCDAGWRIFSFLKLVTDDGIVGWSEYNESFGSPGLSGGDRGADADRDRHGPDGASSWSTPCSPPGRPSRAAASSARRSRAIENALLDIKGKALGVPVYQLFGGKLRDRIPVYWSHCGSYRMRNPEILGVPPVRTYDDLTKARRRGEGQGLHGAQDQHRARDRRQADRLPAGLRGRHAASPSATGTPSSPAARPRPSRPSATGGGPDVGIMLDTNFHFRTEGFRRIAEAVGPAKLTWLEIDAHDPKSIALIRRDAPCPIASGETLLERRDFRPYFEAYAFDTAIVDVIWNGFNESLKIAAMADVYEVNVAPHNFYGHLASAISAHFCAAVPNFRIMEIDIDGVPWRDDIVNTPPVFDNGDFILPTGPGWGVEVNEAGLRKHPPK